jgi:hypothetical protein
MPRPPLHLRAALAAVALALAAGLFAPAAVRAEGERRASGFGLGIGSATIANGLSMKYYRGGGALQGVVGLWGAGGIKERFHHAGGLAVGADYLFEMPSLARSQYFTVDWCFGLGAGFGVQAFSGGSPGLAASGIAGIEFNFTRVPLDLVLEFRPTVGILPDPGVDLIDFTAHFRFYF